MARMFLPTFEPVGYSESVEALVRLRESVTGADVEVGDVLPWACGCRVLVMGKREAAGCEAMGLDHELKKKGVEFRREAIMLPRQKEILIGPGVILLAFNEVSCVGSVPAEGGVGSAGAADEIRNWKQMPIHKWAGNKAGASHAGRYRVLDIGRRLAVQLPPDQGIEIVEDMPSHGQLKTMADKVFNAGRALMGRFVTTPE